jgi:hypothetical protein
MEVTRGKTRHYQEDTGRTASLTLWDLARIGGPVCVCEWRAFVLGKPSNFPRTPYRDLTKPLQALIMAEASGVQGISAFITACGIGRGGDPAFPTMVVT